MKKTEFLTIDEQRFVTKVLQDVRRKGDTLASFSPNTLADFVATKDDDIAKGETWAQFQARLDFVDKMCDRIGLEHQRCPVDANEYFAWLGERTNNGKARAKYAYEKASQAY